MGHEDVAEGPNCTAFLLIRKFQGPILVSTLNVEIKCATNLAIYYYADRVGHLNIYTLSIGMSNIINKNNGKQGKNGQFGRRSYIEKTRK